MKLMSKQKLMILFFCPFFACSAAQISARKLSKAEFNALELKSDSNIFFTAQENGYSLYIPGYEPSEIQTDLGLLPAGVKLISSKKEEYFDEDNQKGTLLHLWFTFTDTGIAKLPPLITKINGRTYYLPFEMVSIYENPNLITPVLSVDFNDKENVKTDRKTGTVTYATETGKEILYRVNIQYFLQVLNYSWKLPKDSIFQEVKRYDSAGPDTSNNTTPLKKEFTPEKFPVADFSWKPLKEGIYELPPLFIEAISYNGSRKQLSLPSIEIVVSKSKSNFQEQDIQGKNNDSIFDSAFRQQKNDIFATIRYSPTIEDCKELARLRTAERHSPLWSTAREIRRDYERSIGLSEQENESKNPLVHKFGSRYGIFAGGNVSPVPEEKTLTHHGAAAQRVKIVEQAAGWLYIESKDFSGWVKEDLIFEIK